jgi:aldose 1-epimerase
MSFSIFFEEQQNLNVAVLKDQSSKTTIAVLPEYGAALHKFGININDKPFNVIDNYNNAEHIKKELALSFKSSKLSPFVCRIKNGKYLFNEKVFEFEKKFIDGSAIHGLLFNKKFSVLEKYADNNKAKLVLQYAYKKDDNGYPFNYRCTIAYTLQHDNLLTIQTTILNESETDIPVADGWHPYFQLGGSVNDWLMQFPAEAIIEFDEKLLPTGNLLKYDSFNVPHLIKEIELDNCFLLKKNSGESACEIFNPENKLRVSFLTDNSYPYLQLYIPPHRKSIAIENLSAVPDCFNNKIGVLILAPSHSQTFTVSHQVSVH